MSKDKKYLLQSDDGYVYKKDEQYISIPDPSLVIDPSGYTFPVYNSSTYFNVKNSLFVDWNVSSVPNWLTYSQKPTGFDASCNANDTGNTRSGNIELVAPVFSADSILVPVSQTYVTPSLTVSPVTHTYDGNGSTRQFTVTSNIPWDVSTYPNWVSIYSKTGLNGNGSFYANTTGNYTGSPRTGSIILKSTTSPNLYPAGRNISIIQPAGRSLVVKLNGVNTSFLEWSYSDGYCCTANAYWVYLDVEVTGSPSGWYTTLIGGTGGEFDVYPSSYSYGNYQIRVSMNLYSSFFGRIEFYWSDTNTNAYSLYLDALNPYC